LNEMPLEDSDNPQLPPDLHGRLAGPHAQLLDFDLMLNHNSPQAIVHINLPALPNFVPAARVTRCVCEKNTQNVAQPIFMSKLFYSIIFNRRKFAQAGHPARSL
jgi:hypothetical protein